MKVLYVERSNLDWGFEPPATLVVEMPKPTERRKPKRAGPTEAECERLYLKLFGPRHS